MIARPAPMRDAILAALRTAPHGLTALQVGAITGQRSPALDTALCTMGKRGHLAVLRRAPKSLFFATAEALEAARPAVEAERAETLQSTRGRQAEARREADRVRAKLRYRKAPAARAPRATKVAKPKVAKIAKKVDLSKSAKWPQAEPIKPRVRTGPRTGWGPDDPMRETPDTIYTYCSAPLLSGGLHTNTHSQF